MSTDEVTDNFDENRFETMVDGQLAWLDYELDGMRFVLVHTEVPAAAGGRGIGGLLVRAAMERALLEGLTVVPACDFARSWMERHPDLVATIAVEDVE